MITESSSYNVVNTQFPHIGARISLFWGHPEFSAYMRTLLYSARTDSRAGFPATVLTELLVLAELHDSQYSHLVANNDSPWDFN